MRADSGLPYGVDTQTPSVARMYDHLLGGKENFPSDRAACTELLRQVPSMKDLALNNREFLRRVVHTLARDYKIRQFIDHGSGLPTQDNVHQVAQRVAPNSRVVYVDNDPIVHSVGGVLLESNPNTAVLHADMRDTDTIFDSPQVNRLINLDEPIAALFVSVLHCIPDKDRPHDLIRRVKARLPHGSIMVICQLVSEDREIRDSVSEFMAVQTNDNWGRVRTHEDVDTIFSANGLEIQDPGLVEVSQWRPSADATAPPQRSFEWEEYGGVGLIV